MHLVKIYRDSLVKIAESLKVFWKNTAREELPQSGCGAKTVLLIIHNYSVSFAQRMQRVPFAELPNFNHQLIHLRLSEVGGCHCLRNHCTLKMPTCKGLFLAECIFAVTR